MGRVAEAKPILHELGTLENHKAIVHIAKGVNVPDGYGITFILLGIGLIDDPRIKISLPDMVEVA